VLRCPATVRAGVGCILLALVFALAPQAPGTGASAPADERDKSFICAWDNALWVAWPAGYARMRLASGPHLPSFELLVPSPDGERVLLACQGEEKVYLLESGGKIRALGKLRGIGLGSLEVQWSPNGRLVAFQTGYADVPVIDLNSGEWCKALPPEIDVETFDRPVGWASARELLVVRTDRVTTSLCATTIHPTSLDPMRKLAERPGDHRAAALSPDRRFAAFWVGAEVLIVGVASGEVKALPNGLMPDPGETECRIAWSPRSDAVLLCQAHGYDDATGERVFLTQEIGVDGSVRGSPHEVPESHILPPVPELPPGLRDQLAQLSSGPDGLSLRAWHDHVTATPMPPEYWLPPAAEPGPDTTLMVSSEPPGAEVYVNGHLKGITPCGVLIASARPWAQRYFVALMKDDLDIVCHELFLWQGRTESLAVNLQTPLTATHLPASLARARNAVRKAIVHRDVEGFIRSLSPLGLAAEGIDGAAQGQIRHWSRVDLAERLRRDQVAKPERRSTHLYGMVFDTCRHLFLTGVYSGQDGYEWQGGTTWDWGASIGFGPSWGPHYVESIGYGEE